MKHFLKEKPGSRRNACNPIATINTILRDRRTKRKWRGSTMRASCVIRLIVESRRLASSALIAHLSSITSKGAHEKHEREKQQKLRTSTISLSSVESCLNWVTSLYPWYLVLFLDGCDSTSLYLKPRLRIPLWYLFNLAKSSGINCLRCVSIKSVSMQDLVSLKLS